MNLLLDTHILLWALNDDSKLSQKAKYLICDANNLIFYSTVSVWEVAIKHKIKPNLMVVSGTEFLHYCEQAGFKKLSLDDKHVIAYETLNKVENTPEHNDPFDKILLAQAKGDGMFFITHDKSFTYYNEPYLILV